MEVKCKSETPSKHDQATIAKALEGHWRAEHLFAWQQALEQYEFLQQQLQACEQQIDACLQTFVTHVEVESPQPTPARKRRAPAAGAGL